MTERAFAFSRVSDYVAAYREGRVSPVDVAERFLTALRASESTAPPLRAFISVSTEDVLRQARAAHERYRRGEPLGPFDGVPVAVKDELDQQGHGTTVGTSFLGEEPVAADAAAVARLRAAGALLVGKTNMQEIGLGVTGINPHHGTARNPYRTSHSTGGSSSGSAAAVAAGLCPVAVSADGGGSVRIPAALCGVVGLKGTFGRVSEAGVTPLCWSLAHIGPIAATVDDAALAFGLMAGPDPRDPTTLGQPALAPFAGSQVEGLKVGWCEEWARAADPELREICEAAVARLVGLGAERVPVTLAHLDAVAPVQYVTIGCEVAAAQFDHRKEHARDYGADVRLLLEVASRVPAVDYLRAQRARMLIRDEFVRALGQVDVLATPMTAEAAPLIPAGALRSGLTDDALIAAMTAFSFPANLTGQPALSLPVGYESGGLPVGLQLIAAHWREDLLIRSARALEATSPRRAPEAYYQLLD